MYVYIENENVLFRICETDKFVQREWNVIYTLNIMKIYHNRGSYMLYTKINIDSKSR